MLRRSRERGSLKNSKGGEVEAVEVGDVVVEGVDLEVGEGDVSEGASEWDDDYLCDCSGYTSQSLYDYRVKCQCQASMMFHTDARGMKRNNHRDESSHAGLLFPLQRHMITIVMTDTVGR